MPTYRTTARSQFRTPSGAIGEAPDGPGGMATLADDVDNMLGYGGAEAVATYAALTGLPAGRVFVGKQALLLDSAARAEYTTAGWVTSGRGRGTAAQRALINTAMIGHGYEYIETDTGFTYRYLGAVTGLTAGWRLWDMNAQWSSVTGGPGVAPSYPSGFKHNTVGPDLAALIRGGEVQLRGNFAKTSNANFADGDALWTMHTAFRPKALAYFILDGGGGMIPAVQVDSNGAVSLHSATKATSTPNVWIDLGGIRFDPYA